MAKPASESAGRQLGARRARRRHRDAARLDRGESTAYGELAPDLFADRRLTILQLGDSHTAADFFTGRVRERLQQAFGYRRRHVSRAGQTACRRPLGPVLTDTVGDWSYEALQRSDAAGAVHLSGFNAVAHRAGAALTLTRATADPTTAPRSVPASSPAAARRRCCSTATPAGEVNLDGGADQRSDLRRRGRRRPGLPRDRGPHARR